MQAKRFCALPFGGIAPGFCGGDWQSRAANPVFAFSVGPKNRTQRKGTPFCGAFIEKHTGKGKNAMPLTNTNYRRIFHSFAAGGAALLVFALGAVGGWQLKALQTWPMLGIAVLFFLAAVLLHRKGRKSPKMYAYSAGASAFAAGLAVSAYYIYLGRFDFLRAMPGLLAALMLLLGAHALLALPKRKLALCLYFVAAAILLALVIFYWAATGYQYYSFAFFSLIFILFHIAAATLLKTRALRAASFAGFGAFALIVLTVLFLISEGDILDGADLADVFPGSGKKAKTPKLPPGQ